MEIIIAIIGSGALSAVISGCFSVYQAKEKKETEEDKAIQQSMTALTNGVRQLLYDRIKYLCKAHLERGYIATNDLDDLEQMHEIYHNDLDGNGFLDDLMNSVKRLPIKPVMPGRENDK